jgi:hypothetical protein
VVRSQPRFGTRVAHTSFCDVCDVLAIGLECTGALRAAMRGAIIAYMPNGGMSAPPAWSTAAGESPRLECIVRNPCVNFWNRVLRQADCVRPVQKRFLALSFRVPMGLRPTQGDQNRRCCHPRVSAERVPHLSLDTAVGPLTSASFPRRKDGKWAFALSPGADHYPYLRLNTGGE